MDWLAKLANLSMRQKQVTLIPVNTFNILLAVGFVSGEASRCAITPDGLSYARFADGITNAFKKKKASRKL
jgi:hypothetical protein